MLQSAFNVIQQRVQQLLSVLSGDDRARWAWTGLVSKLGQLKRTVRISILEQPGYPTAAAAAAIHSPTPAVNIPTHCYFCGPVNHYVRKVWRCFRRDKPKSGLKSRLWVCPSIVRRHHRTRESSTCVKPRRRFAPLDDGPKRQLVFTAADQLQPIATEPGV